MKFIVLTLIIVALMCIPSAQCVNMDDEEQFFGSWVVSLSPIIQFITGTDDSAETFHSKLLSHGARFDAGLNYVKSKGTDNNYNHLAWDSLAYMWPYIRVAYPESELPSWNEIIEELEGYDINRDNFYDNFITDVLDDDDLISVRGALDRLYVWVNKEPKQDMTTIILIFMIFGVSAVVSLNRYFEFNHIMFMVAISINITVGIWLRLIATPFIIIPLLILGLILYKGLTGDNNE